MKTLFIAELALKQIDNLGYQLSKHGITYHFNRHNCIAFLMIQQQKMKGEMARAKLRWGLMKTHAKHLKQKSGANLA